MEREEVCDRSELPPTASSTQMAAGPSEVNEEPTAGEVCDHSEHPPIAPSNPMQVGPSREVDLDSTERSPPPHPLHGQRQSSHNRPQVGGNGRHGGPPTTPALELGDHFSEDSGMEQEVQTDWNTSQDSFPIIIVLFIAIVKGLLRWRAMPLTACFWDKQGPRRGADRPVGGASTTPLRSITGGPDKPIVSARRRGCSLA